MSAAFKIHTLLFLLAFASFVGCDNAEATDASANKNYTEIVIEGNKVDTAYMFVPYTDQGATVKSYTNGILDNCPELIIWASVAGSVNTNIPGTYILNYTANDSLGAPLAPACRTVHVVENSSGFLNGLYAVSCTCTATSGSKKPIITTENYTAVVNPASGRGHFQLVPLNIGAEQVIPQASLSGTNISVGYFSANYHYPNSTAGGTLSPAKNTFTIETEFQRYSPATMFYCKNIYEKLLTIKQNEEGLKK